MQANKHNSPVKKSGALIRTESDHNYGTKHLAWKEHIVFDEKLKAMFAEIHAYFCSSMLKGLEQGLVTQIAVPNNAEGHEVTKEQLLNSQSQALLRSPQIKISAS